MPIGNPRTPPRRPVQVTLDDNGLPLVLFDGAVIVRSKWVFWGDQWQWAGATVRPGNALADGAFASIDVPGLGMHIEQAATLTPQGASVVLTLVAEKAVAKAIGGGIELAVVGDVAALGGVQLSMERAGEQDIAIVRVRTAGGDVLFRFPQSSAEASAAQFVSVEREPGGAVRAFVVRDQIEPGKRTLSFDVALPAGSPAAAMVPPRRALFDDAKRKEWLKGTVAEQHAPIDLSFLNHKPAGARGRVRAQGEALVFGDGTPARFWGTNVQASTLFTGTDEQIRAQAKRIAAFGFNLVRVHHHDSPWVAQNVFDKSAGTTQKLDDKNLDRLDFWVKCLQDEGVYLWIDLHVGRSFLPGDEVPGFDELKRSENGAARGFSFLNARVEALMDSFARAYLTRTNRYTNKTLANDAAVMAVLVTNENDLVRHFGNLFLADKNNPHHQKLFETELKAFAKQSGLDARRLNETWQPGPAKLLLADLEKRFFDRRKQALRAMGYDGMIAFGNMWGDMDATGLLSLSTGDVVDAHSYGYADELRKNARVEPGFLSWIGAAQVTGKPLTATEWNIESGDDRFTAPMRMAAVAALQGWDAPMLYGWTQEPTGAITSLSPWSASMDPSLAALMPAAALLFRQGHVAEGKAPVRLAPSAVEIVDAPLSPMTSVALRTLIETRRYSIDLPAIDALPWLPKTPPASAGVVTVTDLQMDGTAAAAVELRRDSDAGVFLVDSERSVVFSGFVGGKLLDSKSVRAAIETRAATVVLTSLDQAPLSSSKRILVSWAARSLGKGDGKDRQPAYAEPVRGSLTLVTAERLALVPLDPTGQPAEPAAALVREGERVRITLPAHVATHWALLVPLVPQ